MNVQSRNRKGTGYACSARNCVLLQISKRPGCTTVYIGKYMITCIINTQHVVRLQVGSGEYKRTCIVEICHRNWSRLQSLDLNNTHIVSLYILM